MRLGKTFLSSVTIFFNTPGVRWRILNGTLQCYTVENDTPHASNFNKARLKMIGQRHFLYLSNQNIIGGSQRRDLHTQPNLLRKQLIPVALMRINLYALILYTQLFRPCLIYFVLDHRVLSADGSNIDALFVHPAFVGIIEASQVVAGFSIYRRLSYCNCS